MSEKDNEITVPQWRFNEKLNELAASEAENEKLTKKLTAVQKIAEKVPGLETKLTEAGGALEDAKADFDRKGALVAKGITDPEDQEMILDRWKRTPEEDRPALDKWLKGDAKNDRMVKRIFAELGKNEGKGDEKKPGEEGDEKKPGEEGEDNAENEDLPDSGKGVKNASTPGKELTAQQILDMSVEDLKKNEAALFGS